MEGPPPPPLPDPSSSDLLSQPSKNPISDILLPSSDLASRLVLAADPVAPDPSAIPSRSAAPHLPQLHCQLTSSSSRSGCKPPAVSSARDPSRSKPPHLHPPSSALQPPAPQGEIGPKSVHLSVDAQSAQPAHRDASGAHQLVQQAHLGAAAPLSSSPPAGPLQSAAPSSPVAAPLSRPASSIPPIPSVPRQQSYAQVARLFRGPGFVRSHAREVESFARLPRTGANIICGSKEGMPSFSFVNSELPMVEELYANALVMKFHGGRPSLEASHKEIQSWGMEHPFSIGPLSSRAFLLRFQDKVDLLKALTRPSSILITFPYKVYRWHNLCHMKEDSCFAPVWISLPKLPLQCFIPEFLESVANKIGRFLCFDKATSTLARPSAARLCVEIDLRRAPPPFIWVGLFAGFKQQIIYERLPKFCKQCHILGHVAEGCHKVGLAAPLSNAEQRVPLIQVRPPTSGRHNPSHISSPKQVQPTEAPLQQAPAAAMHPTSPAPSQSTLNFPSAAASSARSDHFQLAVDPAQRSIIPSDSLFPQNPHPSPNHPPILCPLCFAQGHMAVECPTGQREATSKQAVPQSTSIRGCTSPVRQNAPRKLSSTTAHQNASSPTNHSSSTPSPPSPPPNPDPPPNALPDVSSTPPVAYQSKHKQAHQPPVKQPESSPKHLQSAALDQQHASSSQQHSSPMSAPPPPPQSSSTFPLAAAHPPISSNHIDAHLPVQPSAASSRRLPAAAMPSSSHGSAQTPLRLPSAAATSPGSVLLCQQPNLEANQFFWEAVHRQLALNEQARLKAPSVDASNSPLAICPSEDNTPLPLNIVHHSSQSGDDSSSRSSVAADSQPNSPSTNIKGAHNLYVSAKKFSYDSEGEEPMTEPTHFQGHNTDDLLWQRPRNSKRNKRHPDQPLKVQLRARKAQNPRPLC